MNKNTFHLLILAILLVFLDSCSNNSGTTPVQDYPFLKKISEFSMSVQEPSGLALSLEGTFLWTVSDKTNKVYKIDFTGRIISELPYRGIDLEGIVQDPRDSSIWVVDEFLSQIVHLDSLGNLQDTLFVTGVNGVGGNNGLEGICINSIDNNFFLIKEQNPGVLIELSESFELLQFKRINFAFDFSGIAYDKNRNKYWVLSDQSKQLFLWEPEQGVINSFDLDFEKAEGIAYNPDLGRIFIVSDQTEKLYIFDLVVEE